MTTIKSKHKIISRAPSTLYMGFTDMRNFYQMLPEDKKAGVEADMDTIKASVSGFNIAVQIVERVAYSKIVMKSIDSPFDFTASFYFDAVANESQKTEFYIEVEAEMNFMMKMMLKPKIQEGLDRLVEGLEALSEGKMPDGIDQETLDKMKEKFKNHV